MVRAEDDGGGGCPADLGVLEAGGRFLEMCGDDSPAADRTDRSDLSNMLLSSELRSVMECSTPRRCCLPAGGGCKRLSLTASSTILRQL